MMALTGNCRLDLVLLSEHIRPEMLWAYPYNALRNAGIARAHTEVCHTVLQDEILLLERLIIIIIGFIGRCLDHSYLRYMLSVMNMMTRLC